LAAAYQPAGFGLPRAIDRVLPGDRAAPDVALRRITERLAEVGASSELLAVSARAVAESLGANGVVVSAWSDPAPESATWGQMVGEESRFPLEYETAVVGELVVASDAAARLDQLVVRRLLGPVAIAAFVVKLTADIRRSRETAVLAREEERRRIRRDLHDGLGPELAGLALGLEGAADLVSRDPDAAGSALAALHEQVGAVIGEVRSLVYGLRPPILDDLGLLAAVRERAAALEASGVAVRLDLPGSIPGLPAAVELSLYRIATEALANIGRHARARTCRLHLEVEDAARLCVEDDGVGLNGARGVGLTAMHERAVELGGSCTVERLADGGTRVSASIPIYA
jgi:signal transduction histidine kinase